MGKRFGKYLVTEYIGCNGHVQLWKCRCECGNESIVQDINLRIGSATQCRQCGYKNRKGKPHKSGDISPGDIFGKLTIVKKAESSTDGKHIKWLAACTCGNTINVASCNLRRKTQTQCGECADRESALKRSGPNHYGWLGGRSFGKYCPRFNEKLKEEIREKYNRKCYICGKPEGKRKHSVHHIDYNKVQGCKGMRWSLVPLCASCHSKTNSNRHFWFNFLYPTHVLEGLDNWGKLGDDIIG